METYPPRLRHQRPEPLPLLASRSVAALHRIVRLSTPLEARRKLRNIGFEEVDLSEVFLLSAAEFLLFSALRVKLGASLGKGKVSRVSKREGRKTHLLESTFEIRDLLLVSRRADLKSSLRLLQLPHQPAKRIRVNSKRKKKGREEKRRTRSHASTTAAPAPRLQASHSTPLFHVHAPDSPQRCSRASPFPLLPQTYSPAYSLLPLRHSSS
jgi:hypothetical protein